MKVREQVDGVNPPIVPAPVVQPESSAPAPTVQHVKKPQVKPLVTEPGTSAAAAE